MSANITLLRAQARALLDELQDRGLAWPECGLWTDLEAFAERGRSEEELLTFVTGDRAGTAAAATTIGLRHHASNAAVYLALHSFCRSQECAEFDGKVAIYALPGTPGQFTHSDRLAVAARWVAYATLFEQARSEPGASLDTAAPSATDIGLVFEALHARADRMLDGCAGAR